MRFLRFLPALLLLPGGLFADPEVHYAPPPDWIAPSPTPELTATPESQRAYGYDYLLIDSQQRLADEDAFSHYVYRVTTEGSLQSAARMTWDFDPSYERLTLHYLRVIRDGQVQERLKPEVVQVIQQEKDLDRHLLNGDLTALVVLDDIRVGDVIDYAFTRHGRNPVFGGRYYGSFTTGWSVPVRHQRQRMIVPAGRTLHHLDHGKSPFVLTTGVEAADGATILDWEARDLPAIEEEKETPSWFDNYPWVQLSECDDWAAVVRWAAPLYAAAETPTETVRQKSAELTRGLDTGEAKTMALVRFVQQEIRYLGMELGAGSFRPNPPEQVLARRFGDCKDKTLLFCTLMRAAGLRAYPALLHTDYRDTIADWLPTPVAFDHVIACVEDEAGRHWVDPTLTYQEGGFATRALPDYRLALPIRPDGAALVRIDRRPGAGPTIRAEETFDIAAFDRPARFRVRTRSTGTSADAVRREFAHSTPDQIAKSYVNYYASAYPGLTVAAPPTMTDDPVANATVVEETYDVPHLWEKRASDGKLTAEFYPKFITDYAVRPDTLVRTTPLAVRFPVDVQLVTTVNLPEDWSITPDHSLVESEAFHAESGIGGHGRVVTMRYKWASLKDHVPAAGVPAHLERLNHYRNALGYTLTYTPPAAATKPAGPADNAKASAANPRPASSPAKPAAPPPVARLNWLFVFVGAVTLGLAIWLSVRLWQWPPSPAPVVPEAQQHLVGLGGWLILVGFGVVVRPLILGGQLLRLFIRWFDLNAWEALTLPGGASYQPGLGELILFEFAANTLMFAGTVLMVATFFARKRAFPTVFIAFLATNCAVLVVDAMALQAMDSGSGASWMQAGQLVVTALVWVPYLLVSRRVKFTFTR